MTLARLMVRRHRWTLTAWWVLLAGLCAGTVPAYQSTYATAADLATAVRLARHSTATTVLYGTIAGTGTPAAMYVWEIGAFVTVLAAVAGVVVAVGLTRSAEDDGTLELARVTGIDPRTPVRTALGLLAGEAAALALGCAVAAGVWSGRVDGVTWPGALALGAVVGLTFLTVAAVTAALAQVTTGSGGARLAGALVVGLSFAARAWADGRDVGWLDALSPLGLRATVRPFAGERWWVLAAACSVPALAGAVTLLLADRREYGSGLVAGRDRRDARLDVRSGAGLAVRLARRAVVTWTAVVACLGALFAAMGSGVVEQSRDGAVGGFLGAQLGTADPAAGYLVYGATVVGILVSVYAVLSVLRARHDEVAGFTAHVLATGARRWTPLAWQTAVTGAGVGVVLLVTGGLTALVASRSIDGPHVAVRAFVDMIAQWPAAMALAGWTALLAGARPRWTGAAWIPLVGSAVLALLGSLLGVPQRVRDLGVFLHVPDAAAAHPALGGPLVLTAVAAGCVVVGLVGVGRRDLA